MEFKKGDRVRFVKDNYITDNDCRRIRNNLIGKVFTIDHNYSSFKNAYIMQEDDRFIFWRSELELVEKNEKIRIVIDPRDSAGAHRAVDEAIAEYRKMYFDWTEEELKQARELFKELAAEWVLDQNDILVFSENRHKEGVRLETCAMCDIFGTPRGNDVFNSTIGKVVCLCKALNKPIPDYINNKNR